MSFTAEHKFWQRRVEKETAARNKFIENVFIKSGSNQKGSLVDIYGAAEGEMPSKTFDASRSSRKSYSKRRSGAVSELRGKSSGNSESFYLYEVGVSDPNKILPREFKPHISTLPGDVAKSTFDRLAEITSQNNGLSSLVLKKPNYRNDYVAYAKTKDEVSQGSNTRNCLSQASRRNSLIPINQSKLKSQLSKLINSQPADILKEAEVQEYTYDGKKKRKRFNEELCDDTISILTKKSQGLTEKQLSTLASERQEGGPSEKQSSKASRTTTFLRAIIKKATARKEDGEKSETPSEYKQKVIGLVNQLDERQLEKLDRVLEEENQKLSTPEAIEEKQEEEENEDPLPLEQRIQLQTDVNADARSVASSKWSRKISSTTAVTVINRLEKQLEEEKSEKDKLRQEIEDLKKMNSQLCEAISVSPYKDGVAVKQPLKIGRSSTIKIKSLPFKKQ